MTGENGYSYAAPKDLAAGKLKHDNGFTLPVGWLLINADYHYPLTLELVRVDNGKATFAYETRESPAGPVRTDTSSGRGTFAYTGEVPKTDDSQ